MNYSNQRVNGWSMLNISFNIFREGKFMEAPVNIDFCVSVVSENSFSSQSEFSKSASHSELLDVRSLGNLVFNEIPTSPSFVASRFQSPAAELT